ncbi:hypothetical protein SEA_ANON_36 [Gordonia phage Anon]|nr:hypothetical protein SEA_ANON_36 [Gordonia phage Anon]
MVEELKLLLMLALYLAPSLVAEIRKVPSKGSVIVVNVLLGWTVIGWIVALAMAARDRAPRYTETPENRPGVQRPQKGYWSL